MNIWVLPEGFDNAFDVLADAGVRLDREAARRDADERGMFVGWHGEYRVDVFVPSVPFYAEALRRRRRVRLAHRETWVLAPEALAVFKMLFYRPKDLIDVRRLLEIQGPQVDRAFIRQALIDMLGADDERIRSWDELVASVC